MSGTRSFLYVAIFVSLYTLNTYTLNTSYAAPLRAQSDQNSSQSTADQNMGESQAATPIQATAPTEAVVPPQSIPLVIPEGTPLRIALDQRTRIAHIGEKVHGKVVEPVYAFDQVVIPAGTEATGQLTLIDPVPVGRRTLAYINGNFSPTHKYHITFDMLKLPDGKTLPIHTTVSQGSAQVVHLVSESHKEKEKRKNIASRAVDTVKQEAKDRVHQISDQIRSPEKLQRIKKLALAQLPYRRQYIQPGTHFNASLNDPLDFGTTTRTPEQLFAIGSAPPADSTLHARLVAEVSSATATRSTQVAAILTEPFYSPDHHLVLPASSRLVGRVVKAQPARKLHHNGELRVIFERIETPEGITQAMQGDLEGVEVDRASNMTLDEEGGAKTTDSKTRYLSTGIAIALAAVASHPDHEHGTEDAAGDPGVRAGAGLSGSRITGSLISLAAKSAPVSIAFGAYGASVSIYSNFLSRGRDVVFVKDTPMEIGFGNPHASSTPGKN